ncbi:helix-turn-helix domain-containing protein [Bacillus taeanensis]|uniref:Transcriptional regulator n=1 Tax=Bacillus taeanensis TaxID=273032 RepID=A0A366XQ61_9BACI|nr:helix-turn-helix transcriptional regulator [Bacillus taeanensis]RBW68252.1 transcriptional regulator [Bacillus taeanensis]
MLWGGKPRSRFGKWLDKNEINQIELERASKLSSGTVSKLCNDKQYRPKLATIHKLNKGLGKIGKNIDVEDFFC